MYQQTRLSDASAVGTPGPIPYAVANWHDAELADLDAMGLDPQFGLAGMGFWPIDETEPSYDPTRQVLVPPTACDKADPVARRWSATATVRIMTAEEFAAANPVPAQVSNYQARSALVDAGFFAKVDAALRGADQTVPANVKALQAWDYANNFYRDSPFITALQGGLGLSAPAVDALFRADALVP